MGSWRRKIVASELQAERDNFKLDVADMQLAFNEDAVKKKDDHINDMKNHPALNASPDFYEMS